MEGCKNNNNKMQNLPQRKLEMFKVFRMMKIVQDEFPRTLGSKEIQKPKVDTVLRDTTYRVATKR